MAKVLVYYAHPGHKYSRVNKALAKVAQNQKDLTFIDLYQTVTRPDRTIV